MAKRTNRQSPDGGLPLAVNRKARREYRVLERLEAGIELLGTEVKSIRGGKIQLRDSYVAFRDHEAWLLEAHISAYSHGNRENHELERPRRLLLNRRGDRPPVRAHPRPGLDGGAALRLSEGKPD